MRTLIVAGAFALAAFLQPDVATADEAWPDSIIDRAEYTGPEWEALVAEAEREPNSDAAKLIGGTVANPADWPASPWVGNCSSTLVGSRVLITASHCVANGGTKSFTIGSTRYSGKCTHHPEYAKNATADWALCVVDKAVPKVPFETIARASEVNCATGKAFTWTGYGCTKWGGGIDGKFRFGNAAAIRCPAGNNYDTITRGSVAVCSGDSGGGGYVANDGNRLVAGTNSRSNTTDTSYVVSTYTDAFRNWAEGWASMNMVEICGITRGADGCRNSAPKPDPDPVPPLCKNELYSLSTSLLSVNNAYDRLHSCLSGQ